MMLDGGAFNELYAVWGTLENPLGPGGSRQYTKEKLIRYTGTAL